MQTTMRQFLLWIALLTMYSVTAAAGSIERVVKLDGESGEGLEFRSTGTILVSKKSPNEYFLNSEVPVSTPNEYRFASGTVVSIQLESKGTRVSVTGAGNKPLTFSASARGWLLRWGETSSSTTAKQDAAKPRVSDEDVSTQATHFVNILRSLAPRGNNPRLVEQARSELQQRKYDEVVRILETAVKDTVYQTEAYQLLAEAYRAKGDTAKFRESWQKYVQAAKAALESSVTTDSIVSLHTYQWPALSSLPPLELPEDLKDLVIPTDEPIAQLAKPTAVESPTATPHVPPSHPAATSQAVLPVQTTDTHPSDDSLPAKRTDSATEKQDSHFVSPSEAAKATGQKEDSGQISTKVSQHQSLIVPILLTVVVTAIGCFVLFVTLQRINERKRLLGNSDQTWQRYSIPETPVPPPSTATPPNSAPMKQVETTPVEPEIPSGMPQVASTYAQNSTLANPEPVYSSEVVVSLDDEEVESIEQDETETSGVDSKRQMIYELDASGLSAREIAQKLGIGQDEVRTFLSLRKG